MTGVPLHCPNQISNSYGRVRVVLCQANWITLLFVMKKVKGPTQAKRGLIRTERMGLSASL
jgi:hypothetical protein